MSPMTRLILIPPIIVSYFTDSNTWLGCRTLLLLLHLFLRAIQIVWIYNPGKSILTPVAGSISNSKLVSQVWGYLNVVLLLLYFSTMF
jgi:hypothetical protein